MASAGYRRVVRNPSLLAVWLSQIASDSGDFVFLVAIVWYVLASTGSVVLVGVAFAAFLIPSIVVAPVAGVYVDRFNRRSVILSAYALQGSVLVVGGALYVGHLLVFPVVLAIILMVEVGHQFTIPANSALVGRAVPKEDLIAANGLLQSSGSTNQLGSSALGGVLVGLLGIGIPLTYDAASFAVGFAIMLVVSPRFGTPSPAPAMDPGESKSAGWLEDFREGVRYVRKDRLMLQFAVVGVIVSFFPMGLQGLWAPYVKSTLSGSASIFGFFEAAFAFGAIIGGLLIGGIGSRVKAGHLLFLGLLGQAVSIMGLGLTRQPILALAFASGLGLSQATNTIPYQALLQAKLPSSIFGRVSTLLSTLIFAPSPVIIVLSSAFASATSVTFIVEVYGIAMLGCVLVGLLLAGESRRAEIPGSGVVANAG
jgi:MFS transporter, DHA3 family, macrolide efflux protein